MDSYLLYSDTGLFERDVIAIGFYFRRFMNCWAELYRSLAFSLYYEWSAASERKLSIRASLRSKSPWKAFLLLIGRSVSYPSSFSGLAYSSIDCILGRVSR